MPRVIQTAIATLNSPQFAKCRHKPHISHPAMQVAKPFTMKSVGLGYADHNLDIIYTFCFVVIYRLFLRYCQEYLERWTMCKWMSR